jgi:tripartite ATP-independent transporter DctP family solute receptor
MGFITKKSENKKTREDSIMKKSLTIVMISLLALILIIAGCGGKKEATKAAETKPIKIKLSVTGADTAPITLGAQKWAELVKAESKGRIEIQVFPNEQLSSGNQQKGLENLRNGVIQASLHSSLIYSIIDPKFSVPSLPWILPDYKAVDKALSGEAGEKLNAIVRSKGIEPIVFMENGYRQITNSVRPIQMPDDLKNMKIRVPSNKMYVSLFKALGADPTVMSIGEVFTSLQQKTIDGQENPVSVIHSRKFYEVQKYLSMVNYSYDCYILGINAKFWAGLDKEAKDLLIRTAKTASNYQIKLTREREQKDIADMKAKGTQINTLTPSQVEAFRNKAAVIYTEYEAQMSKELIDSFKKAAN